MILHFTRNSSFNFVYWEEERWNTTQLRTLFLAANMFYKIMFCCFETSSADTYQWEKGLATKLELLNSMHNLIFFVLICIRSIENIFDTFPNSVDLSSFIPDILVAIQHQNSLASRTIVRTFHRLIATIQLLVFLFFMSTQLLIRKLCNLHYTYVYV